MASTPSNSTTASASAQDAKEEAQKPTPLSAPTYDPITPLPSLIDSTIRFTLLYFTTLFSLDPYRAAQNSPYSVRGYEPSDPEYARRRDFVEGDRVGFRLDPGGPDRRRGGYAGGGGGGGGAGLDVSPCPSCMKPQAQIH